MSPGVMEFILFWGKTDGSCLLHCLKMFHVNFGCKFSKGYHVMMVGGIFCDASTVWHMVCIRDWSGVPKLRRAAPILLKLDIQVPHCPPPSQKFFQVWAWAASLNMPT